MVATPSSNVYIFYAQLPMFVVYLSIYQFRMIQEKLGSEAELALSQVNPKDFTTETYYS